MAMTKREYAAKLRIIKILRKEGYATYAKIFDCFDLNLTKDPSVVAYMVPNKGRIVVNDSLDEDQISMVVRHEILHEYLDHGIRMTRKLAVEHGWDPNNLTDAQISEINTETYGDPERKDNVAQDYEISNRGYTDKDKATARHLKICGQVVSGLVTEDKHPDWVDLSFEEMYDRLRDEEVAASTEVYGVMDGNDFEGMDGTVYGI